MPLHLAVSILGSTIFACPRAARRQCKPWRVTGARSRHVQGVPTSNPTRKIPLGSRTMLLLSSRNVSRANDTRKIEAATETKPRVHRWSSEVSEKSSEACIRPERWRRPAKQVASLSMARSVTCAAEFSRLRRTCRPRRIPLDRPPREVVILWV